MPVDPLFRVVTFFGDADELIVGIAYRLEYLFGHREPALARASARVLNV